MSNIAPSSVSRTKTMKDSQIARRATLPVCLWDNICGSCPSPRYPLTSAWADSRHDWQLPLSSITVHSRSTCQVFHVQLKTSYLDRPCTGEWCIVTMSSGLAQWVGNVALCSGLPKHTSSCTRCNMLTIGLFSASRTEVEFSRVCVFVSRLFFSYISPGSLAVHLYVDCTCVSITFVCAPRAHVDAFVCVRVVIFLCVTLCVDAVKVDAISVNCSRNRIAGSLIDSHFS